MTLLVSGDKINVRTASGAVKFTSDDKLVYKRAVFSGSLTMGNGSVMSVDVPLYRSLFERFRLAPNDFPVLQIRLTACNGNLVQSILNDQITLNFALPISFENSTTDANVNSSTTLSGCTYVKRVTEFGETFDAAYVGFRAIETKIKTWQPGYSDKNIQFNWRCTILSYR